MLELFFSSQAGSAARSVFGWAMLVIAPFLLVGLLVVLKKIFIFNVPPGYVGMVLRGGRLWRTGLPAGWYPTVPILMKGVKVYTGLQRIALEEEARTADNAIVTVRGAGQYRVQAMKAAVAEFEVSDPETIIKDRLLSALRAAIGKRSAAECFEHKEQISEDIINEVKAGLAELGFEMIQVPIIEVSPHKDVVKAINDVQAAQRATDVEKARAEATMVRTGAEATAQAQAQLIRAEGQAKALAAQADGYRLMIQAVTGNKGATLDIRTATSLIMFFENMTMKKAFAASGKASAVVLPDDQEIIAEIAQLVPALVSHEAIEGEAGREERLDHLTQLELQDLLRERLGEDFKALGEEYLDALKTGAREVTDAALGKMPKPIQWLAKRVAEKA